MVSATDQRHILFVEDDHRLAEGVCETLQAAGYRVTWLDDGAKARDVVVDDFDLVVVDLMLPGVHGFDLLAHWREHSDLPVIILTARTDNHDKIRGLELGGDDYVTKPFWPEELLARIKARLRRPVLERDRSVSLGPLRIALDARRPEVDGREVELTRVEFDLLAMLAARLDQAISRARLVEKVLDADREGTQRTLDVHVSRIRKKLGAAAMHLETVWGVGYKLASKPKAQAQS